MNPSRLAPLGAGPMLLMLQLSACAPSTPARPEPEVIEVEERRGSSSRDHRDPLGIPEGHLPAPGECRVWYPGRPAGQQPPPLDCREAELNAPPGTWILYRPPDEARLVHARVTDPERTGVIIRVDLYDAEAGTYLGTREMPAEDP